MLLSSFCARVDCLTSQLYCELMIGIQICQSNLTIADYIQIHYRVQLR